MRSKNFAAAREMLSADESFLAIGTDAHEVWESREAMMPEFEQMASSADSGDLDTEMGELRCYRDGDVGWIVGHTTEVSGIRPGASELGVSRAAMAAATMPPYRRGRRSLVDA